jgi:hypothetical protein
LLTTLVVGLFCTAVIVLCLLVKGAEVVAAQTGSARRLVVIRVVNV